MIEHIDVTDEPEPELGEEWEVSFATAGGPLDHDDPLLDRLLYAVRAFPLGDEWIQGYLAGTNGRQRVIAVIPPGQQHALRREVLARARRAGLHPTRVRLVRVAEPDSAAA